VHGAVILLIRTEQPKKSLRYHDHEPSILQSNHLKSRRDMSISPRVNWLKAMTALLLSAVFSYASAQSEEWFIGDQSIKLEKCTTGFCRIFCPKEGVCLARLYSENPLRGEVGSGGRNPSSGVCSRRSGQISILKDRTGNEMPMCRFRDDSMVNLDGLWIW